MSDHRVTLHWNRNGHPFGYKEYSRDHDLDFGAGVRVPSSAAAEYLGTAELPDPEQAFVGSLSSCHMLTFLAFCSLQKLTLESYTDEAVGFLEKGENGKPILARVELHPKTTFADGVEISAEKLAEAHDPKKVAELGTLLGELSKSDPELLEDLDRLADARVPIDVAFVPPGS